MSVLDVVPVLKVPCLVEVLLLSGHLDQYVEFGTEDYREVILGQIVLEISTCTIRFSDFIPVEQPTLVPCVLPSLYPDPRSTMKPTMRIELGDRPLTPVRIKIVE